MKIEVKSYSSIASLISSIIFFILGAIMFTKPDAIVLFTTYVIGGLIILLGVFKCIKNYLDVKKDNTTSSNGMIIGIILVVIGLVFIFLAGVIEALIRLVIGGWILFSGIVRLINSLYLPKKSSKFFVLLILSLLLIGGGLYTILEANLAFKAMGIVLMIYAAVEIFGYIFNKKDIEIVKETIEPNKEKIVDAILIEKKDKKNKK
ncbi:MAG: DUF308 domain-containing protein [Bacilli bacterium]|nr:DUF308 domain-containing protein [Bacilli bacterium]